MPLGAREVSFARLLALGLLLASAACSDDPGVVETAWEDAGRPMHDAGPKADPDSAFANSTDTSPEVDFDQDGFSVGDGDCDDTSPQRNPGAFDYPDNEDDEDCSGEDATPGEIDCESKVPFTSVDPKDGARAIGLCRFVSESSRKWGVLSAAYVQANGKGALIDPAQVGLLPRFGAVKPRAGARMLALSSGSARAPGQPGYTDDCDVYTSIESPGPTGYPKASPACPSIPSGDIYDPVALELRIRVPTNARSFAFDSNFYTYEYPNFVCQLFNDFFVALLDPKPKSLPDGNVLFDQDGNPVSVNNSLLQVCAPGTYGGKTFSCPQGRDQLAGTGFDGSAACGGAVPNDYYGDFYGGATAGAGAGAATGWLHTGAPVASGGIITLRFAIWDTGDPVLDSLALIDHFVWSIERPVKIETTTITPD